MNFVIISNSQYQDFRKFLFKCGDQDFGILLIKIIKEY